MQGFQKFKLYNDEEETVFRRTNIAYTTNKTGPLPRHRTSKYLPANLFCHTPFNSSTLSN
ncbi:hypothetical protein J6590_099801, partial [Homalodisca vitripennis]